MKMTSKQKILFGFMFLVFSSSLQSVLPIEFFHCFLLIKSNHLGMYYSLYNSLHDEGQRGASLSSTCKTSPDQDMLGIVAVAVFHNLWCAIASDAYGIKG